MCRDAIPSSMREIPVATRFSLRFGHLALLVAWFSAAACALPANACVSDSHDAAAEMRLIKDAYARMKVGDERKAELDQLLPKIDVSLGNLGMNGIYLHANLRGKALVLLGLDRVPRWPTEKADALKAATNIDDGATGEDPLRAAQAAWTEKRYQEAQQILDDALRARGVKVFYPRC